MVKRIYKSMQGREVDMDALLAKNETMPSVGNVRMNARGDELGPGGVIVKKREDIVAEYYEDNPNSAQAEPVTRAVAVQTPPPVAKAPVVKPAKSSNSEGSDE